MFFFSSIHYMLLIYWRMLTPILQILWRMLMPILQNHLKLLVQLLQPSGYLKFACAAPSNSIHLKLLVQLLQTSGYWNLLMPKLQVLWNCLNHDTLVEFDFRISGKFTRSVGEHTNPQYQEPSSFNSRFDYRFIEATISKSWNYKIN